MLLMPPLSLQRRYRVWGYAGSIRRQMGRKMPQAEDKTIFL